MENNSIIYLFTLILFWIFNFYYKMINHEFKSIPDISKAFPSEQICIDHLEKLRWEYYIVSPFDASSKVYQCPNNTYKCKNSGKYFNVKTGTIFHNSKIELQKWFVAIWLITESQKNMTSVALGKELNITQKTAWYIIKRIKSYYQLEKDILPNGKKSSLSFQLSNANKMAVEKQEDKLNLMDWLALYQFKK
ncbi:hypothetical protein [Flavobacterium sp.]|uniref:hypothetical protein n=1 Tax=Flavobacterium sp. TaxID=239 RepID=UPI00286A3DA9|nr:hypothetical protein [Flavobacterium sp.]